MIIRTKTCWLLVIGTVIFGSAVLFYSFNTTQFQKEASGPRNVDALYIKAEALYTNGNYEEAVAIYESLIAAAPEDIHPILHTAHTYRYWGKYEQSETMFLKAVALAPDDPWVYTDLGKLYRNMNEYEKAETAFLKSIDLNPEFSETYSYGLGYLYLEQKRYDESETMFRKALELQPRSEIAYSGLADLLRETGRYQESEAMYQTVFTLNPNSEAYLGLAWLHIYREQYPEAIASTEAFMTNIREKAEVYYAQGVAYRSMGDLEAARIAFARAHELNPDTPLFKESLDNVTNTSATVD